MKKNEGLQVESAILVTGAAGFIGFHLSRKILTEGTAVIGFDNINSYYDPAIKRQRIEILREVANSSGTPFKLIEADLQDFDAINRVFESYSFSTVINLAAQAGVRHSIQNPSAYIESNLVGFGNILEASRQYGVGHLIFASSSSVYGGNTNLPFNESNTVDHPLSLYAATKKSNELMAHSYSHLYGLPATGLRFFTVYGPWGRPDMALFLFTKAIINGEPIKVFNNGRMVRDFTYVDDIVESIYRLLSKKASPDNKFDTSMPNPGSSWAPYRIFNIGNSSPVPLSEYIEAIEEAAGVKAIKEFLPMQPGDVPATAADTSSLEEWIDFKPRTTIKEGVSKFVHWYREYYNT